MPMRSHISLISDSPKELNSFTSLSLTYCERCILISFNFSQLKSLSIKLRAVWDVCCNHLMPSILLLDFYHNLL